MIECKDLDYILAIAKFQSISAAARELHVSQPAITKYLQSLEQRLGVALFNRAKKKLILTLAGEIYIARAAEMAAVKRQLEADIAKVKSEAGGALKVGFCCTGLRGTIMDAIDTLRQREPILQLIFREMKTYEIEQHLLNYKLDIGFISLPATRPELQTEVYYEEKVLLGVPITNPLSALGSTVKNCDYPWVNLAHFKNEPFVLRDTNTRFRAVTDRLFEQYGFKPNIVMTAGNSFTSIEFTEARKALLFLPESFIKNSRDPDAMKFFVTGSPMEKFSTGIAYRKGEPLSVPAHQMIHIMQDLLKNKKS
jgi:DNA-binding transcriptional LysR family regulator